MSALFLTSALYRVSDQLHNSAALPLERQTQVSNEQEAGSAPKSVQTLGE
jgi:hypothetical protein